MSDWKPEYDALFAARRSLNDGPTADDRRRVARRVAARLAIGVSVVTAAEAGHAATAGAAGASGVVANAPKLLTLGKVLLAFAVAAGTGTAVGEVVSRRHVPALSAPAAFANAAPAVPALVSPRAGTAPPIEPEPAASAVVAATVPPAPRGAVRAAPAKPRASVGSLPPAAATAPESAVVPAPPAVPATPPSPYDATGEILALKRIDEAIRGGDLAGASALLDAYDATGGTKHFAPEYQAARALVLCGSGQTAAGQKAACSFLGAHPKSPMAARVDAACAPRCPGR